MSYSSREKVQTWAGGEAHLYKRWVRVEAEGRRGGLTGANDTFKGVFSRECTPGYPGSKPAFQAIVG